MGRHGLRAAADRSLIRERRVTTLEDAEPVPRSFWAAPGAARRPDPAQGPLVGQPVVTVTVLTAFVVYATWAAFVEQELLRRAPTCTAT